MLRYNIPQGWQTVADVREIWLGSTPDKNQVWAGCELLSRMLPACVRTFLGNQKLSSKSVKPIDQNQWTETVRITAFAFDQNENKLKFGDWSNDLHHDHRKDP